LNIVPPLEKAGSKTLVGFDIWWRKEPIFTVASGEKMCRRGLIVGAANKDGGAHVDAKYDAPYEELIRGHGMVMNVMPTNSQPFTVPMLHGHLAAIRQIGFEILNSPAIVALAANARP
jgi:hypothetical protein